MALPKNVRDPEVRARWVAARQPIVAEYDHLRASGFSQKLAARQIGHTPAGVEAMRRSIEHLSGDTIRVGPEEGNGIDLGLAVLGCLRKPGEVLSQEDIAAWCGCSRSMIHHIERRAIAKVKRRLLEIVQGADLAEEVEALFGGAATL